MTLIDKLVQDQRAKYIHVFDYRGHVIFLFTIQNKLLLFIEGPLLKKSKNFLVRESVGHFTKYV